MQAGSENFCRRATDENGGILMDKKYLAEIKARCDKATPGPWYEEGWALPTEDGDFVELTNDSPADASFISHARTDIPALLAEVERLNIILQDERKEHAEEYARLRSTYLDAAAAKDQQTATLKRALEIAIRKIGHCGDCDQNCSFCVLKEPDYFIHQAQEQEAGK
jgi:hypothetical protein